MLAGQLVIIVALDWNRRRECEFGFSWGGTACNEGWKGLLRKNLCASPRACGNRVRVFTCVWVCGHTRRPCSSSQFYTRLIWLRLFAGLQTAQWYFAALQRVDRTASIAIDTALRLSFNRISLQFSWSMAMQDKGWGQWNVTLDIVCLKTAGPCCNWTPAWKVESALCLGRKGTKVIKKRKEAKAFFSRKNNNWPNANVFFFCITFHEIVLFRDVGCHKSVFFFNALLLNQHFGNTKKYSLPKMKPFLILTGFCGMKKPVSLPLIFRTRQTNSFAICNNTDFHFSQCQLIFQGTTTWTKREAVNYRLDSQYNIKEELTTCVRRFLCLLATAGMYKWPPETVRIRSGLIWSGYVKSEGKEGDGKRKI